MASEIPIRNIYYLLCYAWNRLNEGSLVDVSAIDTTELADLLATVLISGTNHLLRRGLEQGYQEVDQELAGIRGRVQVAASARRMLITHGRAHCVYDELNSDTLQNQILKSTLRFLSRVPNLNKELRYKLLLLHRGLGSITDIQINRLAFRRIQLHGNNRFYRFLINVCELVVASWLVDEKTGGYKFRDFVRDEKRMPKLFESFVLNFFRIERPDLDVRRERIYWVASSEDESAMQFLPTMETDISIRDPGCTLIIDTKYYGDMFSSRYDSESIWSGHIYQIFAYVKNLEARGGADAHAKGMLLYPAVDKKTRLRFDMHGHELQVCTINLAQDWRDLRTEMLGLLTSTLDS
jgi:5-methylcytosine-specific restriction enzyme subunit McrC